MVSEKLIHSLRTLSRMEKLHVMQILVSELAQEEADLLEPGQSYPVWSPYAATEAAQSMLEVLQTDKLRSPNG